MDNRYSHFADDEVRNAERLVNKAKDSVELARLQWQNRMKDLLVKDILETLEEMLDNKDLTEEEFAWKSVAAIKFLVSAFTSGILYAQERLV